MAAPPKPDPWIVAMVATTFLVVTSMVYVFYGEEGVRGFIQAIKDLLWIVVVIVWLVYGYYTPPMPPMAG